MSKRAQDAVRGSSPFGRRDGPRIELTPPSTSASPASAPRSRGSEVQYGKSQDSEDSDLADEDYLQDKSYGSEEELSSRNYGQDWTKEEERAIIRKFDRRLVLFMALLYLLSFLDRSNIGNAKIAGMETDLRLSSSQYEWLLTSFYITYIVFEWMTLMYKLIPPHIYIAACVFAWGLIASLQSMAGSFAWLLVMRTLLGVAEAAFGPGVPFYLSFFYKRNELAYRVGLFIAAAPLATSFASSLAFLIVRASRNGPLAPWRALFLVEGAPSIIIAIVAYYYIPDSPSHATYLTPRERRIATLRLNPDTVTSVPSTPLKPINPTKRTLSIPELLSTLLDPPSYITALMFLSANVSFSSLPVFLPTIIHSMGFTSLSSQILSAPPYLLSFFFVLIISSLSDRFHTRSGLLIPVALLSSLSYALNALAGAMHNILGEKATLLLRYISVYGAACGFFASITIIITWTLNNSHTQTGRGTGMAILNIIGQTGPLIGTRLYPEIDGPYYVKGMTVCAGFMVGVAVLAFVLRKVLERRNKSMGPEGYGVVKGDEGDEVEMREGLMQDGSDRHGDDDGEEFRYII